MQADDRHVTRMLGLAGRGCGRRVLEVQCLGSRWRGERRPEGQRRLITAAGLWRPRLHALARATLRMIDGNNYDKKAN